MIKALANALHGRLARGPMWLARAYISAVSLISRNFLPQSLARRIHNSVCGYIYGRRWQAMDFAPREVQMAAHTTVAFVPHLDGFEAEALFSRRFDYEAPVMKWLEANLTSRYRQVIEIGANVGIYTVFFDALFKQAATAGDELPPRILSFEPSPKAYRRLLDNLAANEAQFVQSYQVAVGTESGFATFHEPVGHLTNGSFVREFSEIFGKNIVETIVVTLAAPALEQWLTPPRRTLMKIDVEGFEPELLTALRPVIERHHPDLLLEVLPFTVDALNRCPPPGGLRALSHHRPWNRSDAHPPGRQGSSGLAADLAAQPDAVATPLKSVELFELE